MTHPELELFKALHQVDLTLGLEVTISPDCEWYDAQFDEGMKYKVTSLHVDAGGINIGLSDSVHASQPMHERWLIETDGFRWGDVKPVPAAIPQPSGTPREEQLVEAVAKTIYEGWAGQPGYVPWQEGGNSNMQNLARARARAATQGDHHG